MNRVCLLIVLFITTAFNALGTHIVGGEIEFVRKRGYVYQIILKMYADDINGSMALGQESEAWVGIYDKATNFEKAKVKLIRRRDTNVLYNQVCSQGQSMPLKTKLLIFFEDVLLDDSYNSPAGYYISWQNCCRNSIIKNIQDPINEGMAFYLEFPPIVKNGVRFYNNSPAFPQIVGDFPCKNKPFTMDFSGTDFDGDDIVYKVATPLAGGAFAGGSATPTPGPYDTINWMSGYTKYNQIPGTPAFNINSQTGIIEFTPIVVGLFVFSIIAEEYRDGIKIGAVQRDFQVLVEDCPTNAPNSIELKLPDGSTYDPQTDTLVLNIEQDTCFSIAVSDLDYSTNERLLISLIQNTIPPSIVSFPGEVTVTPFNPIVHSTICLDACNKLFITKDTVFYLTMVVNDIKCPKSITHYDTLNLIIHYKPQINAAPSMGTVPSNVSTINATIGKSIFFDVFGEDTDAQDIITVSAEGEGFNLWEKGMVFSNISGNDSIGSRFRWTPNCNNLTDGKLRIRFIVKDNSCIPTNRDTIMVELNVKDTTTSINFLSPPNLFTPNGDGLNDYFEMPNIPDGNCDYYFKNISIFNRWGAKIYDNNSPDFKWSGDKNPSGVYFYTIDINKKEHKGWIELVR